MKKSKWYHWFLISLCWVVGGIINYFDGKDNTLMAIGTAVFIALGITQFICEKHGEKGKKVFRYIIIGTLIIMAVAILCLLPVALSKLSNLF